MIAEYESSGRLPELDSPREYALSQKHKHLKEMKAVTGLNKGTVIFPQSLRIITVGW